MNRRTLLLSLAAATLNAIPAAAKNLQSNNPATTRYQGWALGTQWNLSLDCTQNPQLALESVRHVLGMIDRSMSPYRSESEISVFNRSDNTQHLFSNWSAPVIAASLEVAMRSNGAFDPTVGPLVNRIGFGPITGDFNSQYSDLTSRNKTVEKNKPGTTLDLCGIAKGHAVDLIFDALRQAGHIDFLFELGGELRTSGAHPSGRPWRIGIENTNGSTLKGRMPSSFSALATSGISQQSYTVNQQAIAHIVTPNSNVKQENTLYSVSVFHRSAMYADAWSTALFVMGKENGIKFAKKNKLTAIFLDEPSSGVKNPITATGYISWNGDEFS